MPRAGGQTPEILNREASVAEIGADMKRVNGIAESPKHNSSFGEPLKL